MDSIIEKYYETEIAPLFNGYVNDKHKEDCISGIKVLLEYMKEKEITFEFFSDLGEESDFIREDLDDFFEKNHLSNGIPIYLEDLTGDHSMEIYSERQNDLMKFLTTLY